MSDHAFSEDQRDALQEIANIGMGSACAKLATLLGRFVELSIPRLCLIGREQLKDQVRVVVGAGRNVTAFRQSFHSDIVGEVMVIFDDDGAHELCDAIYGNAPRVNATAAHVPDELLFEIANLLTGACLSGIFEQLGRNPTFSAPRAIGVSLDANDIINLERLTLSRALLIDINVRVEKTGFKAHLLALMAEDSLSRLCAAIDDLLAAF